MKYSKKFNRLVAKAIRDTLADKETSYVTITYDEGYADPIRVWATINYVKPQKGIDIDIWTMTNNVKYPTRHVKGAYAAFADMQTINSLTKWAISHIREVYQC